MSQPLDWPQAGPRPSAAGTVCALAAQAPEAGDEVGQTAAQEAPRAGETLRQGCQPREEPDPGADGARHTARTGACGPQAHPGSRRQRSVRHHRAFAQLHACSAYKRWRVCWWSSSIRPLPARCVAVAGTGSTPTVTLKPLFCVGRAGSPPTQSCTRRNISAGQRSSCHTRHPARGSCKPPLASGGR